MVSDLGEEPRSEGEGDSERVRFFDLAVVEALLLLSLTFTATDLTFVFFFLSSLFERVLRLPLSSPFEREG